jgi:hypothetical protein
MGHFQQQGQKSRQTANSKYAYENLGHNRLPFEQIQGLKDRRFAGKPFFGKNDFPAPLSKKLEINKYVTLPNFSKSRP